MLESCAPLQNISITLTLAKQMVARIYNIDISNIVYDILGKFMNVRFLRSLTKSIYKIDSWEADVWISNIDISNNLSIRLTLAKQMFGFLILI